MGGNALKAIRTVRLPADRYHDLAARISSALSRAFGCRAEPIPAYRDKPDFGDLDMLVEKEKVLVPGSGREALEDFARKHGHARQIVSNGPVMSYDHRDDPDGDAGFQVDLILTPAAEFDIAKAYFSYNDLGNLMGRIAHKMGFKFGHPGLLLPIRQGTHQVAVLEVSQDIDACLEFMGYDPKRYHQGFRDRQEIYAFASSTAYFNPDIFLLENRNHASRTRDRKRPTYMGFLDHLRSLPPRDYFMFPEDKSQWLPRAFESFPGLEQRYLDALATARARQRLKQGFNGTLVGQWTGRSGKSLAAIMARALEQAGGNEGMLEILEAHGEEGVKAHVLACAGAMGNRPSP